MTAKIKLNAASGGGSFSLQAPSSSANTRVMTLPDTADGTILTTTNPSSKTVIQAKCTPSNSEAQASSATDSYVDVTGIDLTFTPLFSNSTIILVTSFHGSTSGGGVNFSVRLTFNHSGISQTVVDSNQDGYSQATSSGSNDQYGSMVYTHTPNTTNEITYRFQFRRYGSGTVYFNKKPSKIIAYEVAA
jgi:hypothetical protein